MLGAIENSQLSKKNTCKLEGYKQAMYNPFLCSLKSCEVAKKEKKNIIIEHLMFLGTTEISRQK